MPAYIEQRPLEQGEVHRFSLGGLESGATAKLLRSPRRDVLLHVLRTSL
jgi:hypothetical protein